MMRFGDGYYNYGMMGYGWGWIMMICIIVLVVLGIFALSRYLRYSGHAPRTQPSSKALDLLNEKYAQGEISDEEYRRKKSEIMR